MLCNHATVCMLLCKIGIGCDGKVKYRSAFTAFRRCLQAEPAQVPAAEAFGVDPSEAGSTTNLRLRSAPSLLEATRDVRASGPRERQVTASLPFIRCGRLDPLPSQSRRTHMRRGCHFSEEVRFYELAKLSRVPLMQTQCCVLLCDLESRDKARCQQPVVLDGNVNKAHTPAVEPPDAEPSEARPNTSLTLLNAFCLLERSSQRRDGKRGLVLPGWMRCPIRPKADGRGGSASSVLVR